MGEFVVVFHGAPPVVRHRIPCNRCFALYPLLVYVGGYHGPILQKMSAAGAR